MSKTLAELRADRPKRLAESSITVCLAPDLVAEIQSLGEELNNLTVGIAPDEESEQQGPPKRMVGPKEPPRAGEIRARMGDLLQEIANNEGQFRLRATKTDGEWRLWCNSNPSRGEGEPGFERDLRFTAGHCNSDALIDDIGSYVVAWNGDPLEGSDWDDVFKASVGLPDKAQMASIVTSMYESRLDFPQWRSSLSANLRKWSDYVSLDPLASATDDSTDGSPGPSAAAMTATANRSR